MENLEGKKKLFSEEIIIPSKGDQFMDFEIGENRFRVLGQFHEGYVVYDDKKPKMREVFAKDACKIDGVSPFTDEELASYTRKISPYTKRLEEPVYFWAMLVYNQIKERFQVLKITQISVINQMMKVLKKPDFQEFDLYDFEISKSVENGFTKYLIATGKDKPLTENVMKKFETLYCDVSAIFRDEYPFDKK